MENKLDKEEEMLDNSLHHLKHRSSIELEDNESKREKESNFDDIKMKYMKNRIGRIQEKRKNSERSLTKSPERRSNLAKEDKSKNQATSEEFFEAKKHYLDKELSYNKTDSFVTEKSSLKLNDFADCID